MPIPAHYGTIVWKTDEVAVAASRSAKRHVKIEPAPHYATPYRMVQKFRVVNWNLRPGEHPELQIQRLPGAFPQRLLLGLGCEGTHRICDEDGLNAQASKAKASHFDAVFGSDSKYDGARRQSAHQAFCYRIAKNVQRLLFHDDLLMFPHSLRQITIDRLVLESQRPGRSVSSTLRCPSVPCTQ